MEDKVISGLEIGRSEAARICSLSEGEIAGLISSADRIRSRFRGPYIDVCAIVNAKSGGCPEDCSYCAQSARSSAAVNAYPLTDKRVVLEKAAEARQGGARRFCIVTSGRSLPKGDLRKIGDMIGEVRRIGLLPCATLGLLQKEDLLFLKNSGLERFHHNIETSERFFPEVCTTHTFRDKMKTIEAVKSVGLSLCSGGIFGLGETWEDRVDMAFTLREIGPDSVPINFLIPVEGTRLGSMAPLGPLEALKIICLYRFVLPDKEIRVCGGRVQTLEEFQSMIFFAGADGLLSGNYLTTTGRGFDEDMRFIGLCGLRPRQ